MRRPIVAHPPGAKGGARLPRPIMSENEALGPGIEFTETMRGFLSLGTTDDYKSGYERGKQDESPFEFTVTVTVDDVEKMIQDPQHTARMTGSVRAPKVSPDPLTVSVGQFHLLVRDPATPLTRKMIYRLKLLSSGGKHYYMEGFKL